MATTLSRRRWRRDRGRDVTAGLIDASCASLATFAAGLAASSLLAPALLGVYALYFSGFLVGAIVPAQLVLTPVEVIALQLRGRTRTRIVSRSIALGLGPAVLSATLAAVAALLLAPPAPRAVHLALASTAIVAGTLSPIQDHLRRVLHLAGFHDAAAQTSAVQLLGVVLAILGLRRLDVAPAWLPFGALAAGNAGSLLFGLALAYRNRTPVRHSARTVVPRLAGLAASGRWLLLSAILPNGATFVVSAMVGALAGGAVLGQAEAARVLAQPVLVLATGLGAIITPQSMAAGAGRREAEAHRLQRHFYLGLGLGGGAYAVAVGVIGPQVGLDRLVPVAFAVPGLILVTIAAHLAIGGNVAVRAELVGARQERRLIGTTAWSSAAQIVVGASAGITGPFARPLALLVQAATRGAGFRRLRRLIYQDAPAPLPRRAR